VKALEGVGECNSKISQLVTNVEKKRIGDTTQPPTLVNFASLASRTADPPLPIPERLPASLPKSDQPRFAESSIYPYLETNVDHIPMAFTQEPIPTEISERSLALYGPTSPFRHWEVLKRYITSLIQRKGYEDFISYSTTVERVEKVGSEWKVTLRKEGKESDYWWVEWFDAVVVASGHYSVPYVPKIEGLEEFENSRPGSVLHSKYFRGKDQFKGKVSIFFWLEALT
jgi:cation diffusion facilitator CzcD-associated flavoprotein CzcO